MLEKKFYIGNIEIKNSLQLKNMARQIHNNQTELTLDQIYNNLTQRIRTVTKSTIVPSANYKMDLLNEKI